MHRSRPISLALIGVFVWLTSCTSYKQIQIADVVDHGKVRVTTTDGERATVHDPRLEADSIKGQVNEGVEHAEWIARSIPVDQVIELEAVGTNTAGTALLVVGSLAVIFFVVAVVTCNGFECG